MLRCVQLSATPRTVASQAPLSMGFSKQEHWRGLPLLPPGDLPNTGIKPGSPTLQADSLPSEPPYMCLRPDQLEMNPEIFFCAIYFTSTWGTSTSEVEFTVIYSQDGVGSA